MYCPNCGAKMKDYYCEHCGYMKNGSFIRNNSKRDENVLSYYFGNRYDYYVRNRNWYVPGILGPIYIMARKYFLVGLLLFLLDISITLSVFVLNHVFLVTNVVRVLNVCYFLVNRLIWAGLGNLIYIKLLYKRLYKEKLKSPNRYKEHIQDYYLIDTMFLKTKYIIYGSIGFIIFIILREIIYTYLSLS